MNKSEPPNQPVPLIIEDHRVPELYVSQVLRCDVDMGGVVRLTFVSNHADSASPTGYSQCINLRLIMTPSALENMCEFSKRWLDDARATNAPIPPDVTKH
jgi:hypothetical protein